jgi:hypothetical protein
MEKLSGLVLDVYDDPQGEVMRELYPRLDTVPEYIKEAHYLSPEERSSLPSDAFALELVDGDVVLRKYACTDAGNTALALSYFLSTCHKLPVEAQKVAAANLLTACGWYDLEPPEELQKVALMGMVVGALGAPTAMRKAKANMQVARASGGNVNPSVLHGQPE